MYRRTMKLSIIVCEIYFPNCYFTVWGLFP